MTAPDRTFAERDVDLLMTGAFIVGVVATVVAVAVDALVEWGIAGVLFAALEGRRWWRRRR